MSYFFKITNVGLLTGSFTPNPLANPWANAVLPAPKSPLKATTAAFLPKINSLIILRANIAATLFVSLSFLVTIILVIWLYFMLYFNTTSYQPPNLLLSTISTIVEIVDRLNICRQIKRLGVV